MQKLRRYDAGGTNDKLFCYQAEGWNRDGLALRAVGKLMEKSPMERRLLVVLTDADPNDECALSLYQEYSGRDGIKDAQEEVQALKKKGIKVVAVFMGLDYNVQTASMIYGKDFVRITEPTQLAEAVSSIIRRQLREW
jgi:nitric oxide reductase activation protein